MKSRYDLSKNWDNLSKEEQAKLLEKELIKNEGDKLAQEKGFSDINDFFKSVKSDINVTPSDIKEAHPTYDDNQAKHEAYSINERAKNRAATLLNELVVKVFKQTLIYPSKLTHLSWANTIASKYINEGDGEQILIDLMNGIDVFDKTKYVPEAATEPKILQDLALFYENNAAGQKVLTQGATQYKDRFSVQMYNWTFALREGVLSSFVSERIARLKNKFDLYKADNFVRKITSMARLSANKATALNNAKLKFPLVEGQADNLFDAMHEVQEILLSMKNADNKYLLGTDPDLKAFCQNANMSNTYMLCSEKLYSLINSGVKSQLFNYQLWGLSNIIPQENIIPMGKMWNIPNAFQFSTTGTGTGMTLQWTKTVANPNTPIGGLNDLAKQADNKYIEDSDTWLMIINLDGCTNLMFLEQSADQFFGNNLTHEHFLHVWLQNYISLVTVGAVYSNPNMYVLPNTLDANNPYSEQEQEQTQTKVKKSK